MLIRNWRAEGWEEEEAAKLVVIVNINHSKQEYKLDRQPIMDFLFTITIAKQTWLHYGNAMNVQLVSCFRVISWMWGFFTYYEKVADSSRNAETLSWDMGLTFFLIIAIIVILHVILASLLEFILINLIGRNPLIIQLEKFTRCPTCPTEIAAT